MRLALVLVLSCFSCVFCGFGIPCSWYRSRGCRCCRRLRLFERGRVMVLRQCITSRRPFLRAMPATLHQDSHRLPWAPWSRSSPTRPRVERLLHVEMWWLPIRPSCRRMYLIRLHSLPALLAALAQSAFIHSPVSIPCQVTGP